MSTSSATMPSKPPRKISTFSLRKSKDPFSDVESGLKHCYGKFLKPFEESCQFSTFHSPALSDADFSSKPLVLLIGQYSTGRIRTLKFQILGGTTVLQPNFFFLNLIRQNHVHPVLDRIGLPWDSDRAGADHRQFQRYHAQSRARHHSWERTGRGLKVPVQTTS